VAFMSESLRVAPGQRILEIGTGSGYQAALLAHLGARVWTVERISGLLSEARAHWDADPSPSIIQAKVGDGYLGWPDFAPFDRILLTASPREVPEVLLGQLVESGLLLMPLVVGKEQRLIRLRREGSRAYREDLGACSFVPMLARTVEG